MEKLTAEYVTDLKETAPLDIILKYHTFVIVEEYIILRLSFLLFLCPVSVISTTSNDFLHFPEGLQTTTRKGSSPVLHECR